MTFYSDLAASALALLEEYGQSVTLSRTVRGAYSTSTGAPATGTTTTYTGTAAMFEYVQRDEANSDVRAGDQMAYIATDGMVLPRTGDTVTVGGTTYSVITGQQINPAGTAVLYQAQLRGVA